MKKLLISLFSACAILGCGKDKTLKDYHNEQAQNELARLQAIQGRYTGIVIANSDKRTLGALQLVISARLKGDPNGNLGSTTGRAYLEVGLDFVDSHSAHISSTDTYYNSDQGLLQVNFTVKRDDDNSETVTLSATVSGAGMSGFLVGQGFSSRQGNFTLRKDGESLEELSKTFKGTLDPDEGLSVVFVGRGRIDNNDPPAGRELFLTAYYPDLTPVSHFMKVFLPESRVSLYVDLEYHRKHGLHVIFPVAHWDVASGLLSTPPGDASPDKPWVPQLRCTNFYFSRTVQTFTCDYWSNRTSKARLTFQPVRK